MDSTFDAKLTLTLLDRQEDYVMDLPDYHVKGLLFGTTTIEFGGPCTIQCKKTGYTYAACCVAYRVESATSHTSNDAGRT